MRWRWKKKVDPEPEKDQPLEPGRDYYEEHGRMVFTAEFLLRRGYCCQSGCRHCPYSFEEE
ncbi:MAG: hypothetical protein K9I85_06860 [Saprospiraceae bacterium]|nr:hypothetical protein [Saprospiraceae bacterium]